MKKSVNWLSIWLHACWGISNAILIVGCGSGDPFSYVRVSGSIAYEDGSLIPLQGMVLQFHPEMLPIDAKTHPRCGSTIVNATTGEFDTVTSHSYGDGLVPGKHKVVILAGDRLPISGKIIPSEYCDPDRTPLEVDTSELPFLLRVRKP